MISVLALVCVLGLSGCQSNQVASNVTESTTTNIQEIQQTTQPQTQQELSAEAEQPKTTASEEKTSAMIAPLPVAIDITKLEDCTVAVSLEEGAVYKDETGTVMMDATVFTYDIYDMIDVALMKEGDTILRAQEETLIRTLERSENGLVLINGGLDQGGFCLHTEGNTVYYELGHNDVKAYYALGKVSLPVSPDFVYHDASDLDKDAVSFRAEDFLDGAVSFADPFDVNHTTIRIEKGLVAEMTRVYAP